MDLDALLRPRGPLPAGVYWRRRLVLVGLLLLVFVLLGRAFGGGGAERTAGDGSPSPSPSPSTVRSASPSTSPSPSPSPSPSASRSVSPSPTRAANQPCRDSELRVDATSDDTAYAAGERPVLTLAVTNVGPVACTRDVGQAARELRVRSGNDRVWSSDDCAPGGSPQVVSLQPNVRRVLSTVTWSRLRSAPGCPTGRESVQPGTYQVIGRLGTVEAVGTAFQLS